MQNKIWMRIVEHLINNPKSQNFLGKKLKKKVFRSFYLKNQTEFRLVPYQSEKFNYNPNLVLFKNIQNTFLCVGNVGNSAPQKPKYLFFFYFFNFCEDNLPRAKLLRNCVDSWSCQYLKLTNPLMPSGAFNICCPRDCVSRHNGGTRGSPIMPRDAVSRTANVERTARH